MQLFQDEGTNDVVFSADNMIHDWSGTNPDIPLVLQMTNDMTREVANVTLLKTFDQAGVNIPAIVYGDGRIRGHFLCITSGGSSGEYSKIYLQPRGYWSYVIYEHTIPTISYPTGAELLSNTFLTLGLGGAFKEVDRGKALVVSPTQYAEIITGSTLHGVTKRDFKNGEVFYASNKDKTAGSMIDTDDNFIHVP